MAKDGVGKRSARAPSRPLWWLGTAAHPHKTFKGSGRPRHVLHSQVEEVLWLCQVCGGARKLMMEVNGSEMSCLTVRPHAVCRSTCNRPRASGPLPHTAPPWSWPVASIRASPRSVGIRRTPATLSHYPTGSDHKLGTELSPWSATSNGLLAHRKASRSTRWSSNGAPLRRRSAQA